MKIRFERFPTLAKARARCADLARKGGTLFTGIYRGHRGYVVQIWLP